jgi:hypothetical protein
MNTDDSSAASGTETGPGRLTAPDVKTYATLAHIGAPLGALVFLPLMWVPALAFYLVLRGRDHGGLLRGHLGQAASFAVVLTGYALLLRIVLGVAEVDGWIIALVPVAVVAAAAYPTLRAVRAAQRLEPFTHPKPLAWIPLD